MATAIQHHVHNEGGHPAPLRRVVPLTFSGSPMLLAAIGFAIGVVGDALLASRWQSAALRCVAAFLLIVVAAFAIRRAPRLQLVCALVVWIAVGWAGAGMEGHPAVHAPIDRYADKLMRNVRGVVRDVRELPRTENADEDVSPSESEADPERNERLWLVDIDSTEVEEVTPDVSRMLPTSGGVRIIIAEQDNLAVRCGDVVELPVRMHLPERYRDPGVWQHADWLSEQNIAVQASTRVKHLERAAVSRPTSTCIVRGWQRSATRRLINAANGQFLNHFPSALRIHPADAGVLAAMLVGDRARLAHAERLNFERTGTFHLVVVAGMHVGLLAAALVWLFTRMGMGRIITTVATMLVVSSYALLTGFGQPVQRALLMTLSYLIARSIARRASNLNALGFAALVMLAIQPSSLFEASFQMTVLAVVAIAGIAPPLGEHTFLPYARALRNIGLMRLDQHMHPRLAQTRVMVRLIAENMSRRHRDRMAVLLAWMFRCALWSIELLLMSVVSELLMALPMMVYFHRLTPAALPANLLAVPLIAPLMLCAGGYFAGSLIHPAIGAMAGVPCAALFHLLRAMLHALSSARFADVRTPAPAAWQIAIAIAAYAIVIWLVRKSSAKRAALAAGVLLSATLLLLVQRHPNVTPGTIEITALDVAQGDSLLAVAPNGGAMLIDAGGPTGRAGSSANASSGFDFGEAVVSTYLWQRGFRKLDVVVITHAHSDHIGGMLSVLQNFRPRELWLSVIPPSPMLAQILDTARAQRIPVRMLRAGDTVTWNDVSVHALAPAVGYVSASPNNDDSLVLRMQWHKASALLEGDAESSSEGQMLRNPEGLAPATLLKVAHHGSRTSTIEPFLDAVHPRIALVSDGRDNTFGHPRMEVIARLADEGAHVFRTDMHGATTVLLYPDGRSSVTSFGVR